MVGGLKIVVIGAGAMGGLYGGLLRDAGEDVVLVDIWREHVERINERGLVIEGLDWEKDVRVAATTSVSELSEPPDLIIIFTKSYDTAKAAESAAKILGDKTMVLTLQSGFDNADIIARYVGKSRVLAGITTFAAVLLGPGRVFYGGAGITVLGELQGGVTERVEEVVRVFNNAGLNARASEDIMGWIWSKEILNVGINPVTALTGLRNGELLERPELLEVSKMAMAEAAKVAETLGIKLRFGDPYKEFIKLLRATSSSKSSMLQDIERGRRTEIDSLCGAIVSYGKALGVKTPVNLTLYSLVKVLERLGRPITGRLSQSQLKTG